MNSRKAAGKVKYTCYNELVELAISTITSRMDVQPVSNYLKQLFTSHFSKHYYSNRPNKNGYTIKLTSSFKRERERERVPWNENPNIASNRMSKLLDKSTGSSSTDRKGMGSDSNYKNLCISRVDGLFYLL